MPARTRTHTTEDIYTAAAWRQVVDLARNASTLGQLGEQVAALVDEHEPEPLAPWPRP